jgi:hypothetical protein
MHSISGDLVSVQGVLRNVVFTIRGKTFRRDVYVSDCLDNLYDLVLGASLIRQLVQLSKTSKRLFAGWFARKKATTGMLRREAVLPSLIFI